MELFVRDELGQYTAATTPVIFTDDGATFFVESSDSKIAYRVELNDDHHSCTCDDYTRGLKKDENFTCKHIMAVISSTAKRDQSGSQWRENHAFYHGRRRPRRERNTRF